MLYRYVWRYSHVKRYELALVSPVDLRRELILDPLDPKFTAYQGAYTMKRQLESKTNRPLYPTYSGDEAYPGEIYIDPAPTGDFRSSYGFDPTHKFLDDRNRYGNPNTWTDDTDLDRLRELKDSNEDSIYLLNEINQDWFDKNYPSVADGGRRKRWIDGVQSPGDPETYFPRIYTNLADPWSMENAAVRGTIDMTSEQRYPKNAPSITNFADITWDGVTHMYKSDRLKYLEGDDITLNEIPYLIDRIPSLEDAPHLEQEIL